MLLFLKDFFLRKTSQKYGKLLEMFSEEGEGKNGFGFDEIFELPNGLTLGELTLEEKLKVSPRKRTLDMVEKYIKDKQ